jgi:hypothetical protein
LSVPPINLFNGNKKVRMRAELVPISPDWTTLR